jgi:hypothetical protein
LPRNPRVAYLVLVRSMLRILVALLLSVICAFAKEPAPVDAPYNKVFDPWHACMDAEELAKAGAPDALRTLFLAAYVRVNQLFLGGEDLETMSKIFMEVLTAVGDDRFASALSLQRAEIRSATRWFLSDSDPKNFPKTSKLLHDAPKIDWPLSKAYRDDR